MTGFIYARGFGNYDQDLNHLNWHKLTRQSLDFQALYFVLSLASP